MINNTVLLPGWCFFMAIDCLFTRLTTICSILCPLLSTRPRLSPRRDCGHDQGVSAMQFTHKKNRSLYIPYAGPVLLEFPSSTRAAPSVWKSAAISTFLACCRKWLKPSKSKRNAPGSSIRDSKLKSTNTSTCVTSRTPTKPCFIA